MISVDLLYQGLLLPAAGLIGLAAASGDSSTAEPEEPPTDRERQTIRARNSVRLIRRDEEGSPVDRLPAGVYGFSCSPATEALPLFAKLTVGSFEFHKTLSGETEILGYLTQPEVEGFASGVLQDVKLYPEPREASTRLTSIPSARIVRAKGPSRSDGNYLTLTIR